MRGPRVGLCSMGFYRCSSRGGLRLLILPDLGYRPDNQSLRRVSSRNTDLAQSTSGESNPDEKVTDIIVWRNIVQLLKHQRVDFGEDNFHYHCQLSSPKEKRWTAYLEQ